MKIQLRKSNLVLLLVFALALGLLLMIGNTCSSQGEPEAGFTRHRHNGSFFRLDLPSGWSVDQHTEGSKKMTAVSPDGGDSIFVYTIKAKGEIDIDRLADRVNLNWAGIQTSSRTFKRFLRLRLCLLKTYQKGSLYTRAYIMSKDIYGYVLVWRGRNTDTRLPDQVARSFKVKIPVLKAWPGKAWRSAFSFVIGLLGLLAFLLVSMGFGWLGYTVRKGVISQKTMRLVMSLQKVETTTDKAKWAQLKKRASRQIVLPIAGLIVFYLLVWVLFSPPVFFASLLGLVVVVLGYFGILSDPAKSVEQYIESSLIG